MSIQRPPVCSSITGWLSPYHIQWTHLQDMSSYWTH
nr:MAG TPA_asm: hypothetical protein [Bacteriophage sp.]